MITEELPAPDVTNVPAALPPQPDAPVRQINQQALDALGKTMVETFERYKRERHATEQQWLKNLRQYLGVYDPEIKQSMDPKRSMAYPRMTRVKCISVLARLMNLMFPGNERNWELNASPNAEMSPEDIKMAVEGLMQKNQQAGVQMQITEEMVQTAIQNLADDRAKSAALAIDDQLQELGGDQTLDYIALNRQVLQSGIIYGTGVMFGPFVRTSERTVWQRNPITGQYTPTTVPVFKPQFDFLPVWDFYPDMSAKTFYQMDGYFRRYVFQRNQLRKLAERTDFIPEQIRKYLARNPKGNYKPLGFETELRQMGLADNVNLEGPDSSKYEVRVWHGYVTGQQLRDAGAEVKEDMLGDDIEAELWMIDNTIIKAEMNAWRSLGIDVRQVHIFSFDQDDTSIFSRGLPEVVRDTQMSICAATRMLMDNASVVCGPNIEINMDLVRLDQDLKSVHAYKFWYRNGEGVDSQYPAIREIPIASHLQELMSIVELHMKFMDAETFVGPATGGDMARGPSEPMRTAAGASMLRGDAALPFKDIVRNFDTFTQSYIYALVQFNRKFNADKVKAGDYDVVARGATSLIAKEVRGMQLDQLAQTLRPEEVDHIDERKFLEARLRARDLENVLVPQDEAERRKQGRQQMVAEQAAAERQVNEATVRKLLADAFKAITQGEKNLTGAQATQVTAAISILQEGMADAFGTGPETAGGAAGGKSSAKS